MILRRIVALSVLVLSALVTAQAQIPGQNVNMVAGTMWPGGDPFLQRQNEPSMAVSSRNPLHILGGANDYRTVDLPGLPEGGVTGDAWLGLFKSTNGGGRWTSVLLPGYPQDNSPEGLASPLKGLQAGADAMLRAGSHGLFYYSGLAFNRGEGQPSAIFVARYQDRNNTENGDPFQYQGTTIVARNAPGDFLDKPALAVDIPRAGSGTCDIGGAPTRSGSVYAAWTIFLGDDHPHGKKDSDDDDEESATSEIRSRIVFSRSSDCAATWSVPVTLSDSRTNQSASIAIDPRNGHIYVAWRQFETWDWIHAIKIVKSIDGGRTFSRPVPIWGFFPFDQGTTGTSFRTNSYPCIAVDHTGRVYAAWSARGYAPGNHHPFKGDARIVVATSRDGRFWTFPRAVDNFPGRGHQIMPALSIAGGKLQLVYYDFREDVSGFFQQYVDELSILNLPPGTPGKKRHTVDVRTAQADPGQYPQFASYAVTPIDPSAEASRYMIGSRPGSSIIEQLQFSPPNLPLFGLGTVPFIGDYIDITGRAILPARGPGGEEQWRFSGPGDDAVFPLVWSDNRDVRPPADGNWSNYTPPTFAGSGGPSIFDPTQTARVCVPGQAGMRNQNIYTSRVSPGLVAGSPGNAKPLSTSLPRAFVVFAQNTTAELALYRFSIRNQPVGGAASFEQFAVLTFVDVLIPAGSSGARTVYVTSTDPKATVLVDIVQIAGAGVPSPPPDGRSSTVVLNPDITNPDITNPDITNPDITNPDITNAEVHNPDITNPDITNPDITNPDITNPDITNPDITNADVANPDITNPDITNPDITNPDITNPDITNPDITNPDITNGSISDYSYTATNEGNTSSQYEVDLEATDPVPGSIKLQLIIHRIYRTPVIDGCTLKQQTQNQVLLNLPRPLDFTEPITFWMEPGEQIKLTFRVVDTNRNDDITWAPTESLRVTVRADGVNWDAETGPEDEPASDTIEPTGGDPLVVVNSDEAGPGSLRAAIAFANENPNGDLPDTISFNIPGDVPHRINLDALLPVITDPVVLDGTSHPGYEGVPVVILDGSDLPRDIEGAYGLAVTGGGSVIRGLGVVNIPGKGIVLSGGGENLVQGNWVGIDPATGEAAPTEEAGIGILDGSSGNVIGVTCIPGDVPCQFGGERNIVSGNNGAGVAVYSGSGNMIRGNLIGTNASATEPVPNFGEGVAISGGIATQLGSTVSGHGNVISGNGGPGVLISREAGNQDQTVVTGNVIANNGAPGIVILSGENIPILGNSIYGNLRLGIDLGADGPTENDPSDADQGANRLQNSPQLEAAVAIQAGVFISGMAMTEAPNVPIRVEFFRNAPCSATNETPQARDLVHVFTGLSNADGVVTFQENVVQGLSLGDGVTATATASLIGEVGTRRNTSEISNCTTVIPSQ
jgi:hypothetical protein